MTEPGKTQDELTEQKSSFWAMLQPTDIAVVLLAAGGVALVFMDAFSLWMLALLPVTWGYLRRGFGTIFAGYRNRQTVVRGDQSFCVLYFPEGSTLRGDVRFRVSPRVEVQVQGMDPTLNSRLLNGWLTRRESGWEDLCFNVVSEGTALVFWAPESVLPKPLEAQQALLRRVLVIAREVMGVDREALEAWAASSASPELRLIVALMDRPALLPGIVEDPAADAETAASALGVLRGSLSDAEAGSLARRWLAADDVQLVASGLSLASGLDDALAAAEIAASERLVTAAVAQGPPDKRWVRGLEAAIRCLGQIGGVSAVPGLLALWDKPWREHRVLRRSALEAARTIQSRQKGAEAGSFALVDASGEAGAISVAKARGALSLGEGGE